MLPQNSMASTAFCETAVSFSSWAQCVLRCCYRFVAGAVFHSFASIARRKRTLCGDRACRRTRLRCGAARMCLELSEIVRVEALSLRRRANVSRVRQTLCGDCACRSTLAVAPCKCLLSTATLAVARCECELGEPSAQNRACRSALAALIF